MDPLTMGALKVGASAVSGTLKGVSNIVSSAIGGRARRQEQREATRELGQRKQAYESFQFTNPYANMENPYEDMTVNQQQAQFQAQQQQQALASTMSGMQQAAGSSGIAGLAQAMAQQQAANLQASAASIGEQESRIQQAKAQQAAQNQQLAAEGAAQAQQMEFGRTSTMYGLAGQRKAAADAARQQATQQLIGGITQVATAGLDALSGSKNGNGSNSGGNAGNNFMDRTQGMMDAVMNTNINLTGRN